MAENDSEKSVAVFHERPDMHQERVMFPVVASTAAGAVIGVAMQIALSAAFGWRKHSGKLADIIRAESNVIINGTVASAIACGALTWGLINGRNWQKTAVKPYIENLEAHNADLSGRMADIKETVSHSEKLDHARTDHHDHGAAR